MIPTINFFKTTITFLITFPAYVFAQSDYVVTIKGDTLKGELKPLFYEPIDRVQIFSEGKKTIYTALQIRSYKKEGFFYQPIRYENSIRFMKVLKEGFLSFYAFNLASANTWDGRYLSKKDGTGLEVPNLSFKKAMTSFLSDCPDIKSRMEKGEFAKRDIERIVDLYNFCLKAKTEASLKSSPPTVVNNEKILAVKNLVGKVEAENFLTKKDALDMLKDIQSKVSKNEAVPNYLIEGLKSYLIDTPSLSKELESVLVLLKK